MAQTPGVKAVAGKPLPDDDDAPTPAYESTDSDVPSPPRGPRSASGGGSSMLFPAFTMTSVLATVVLALFLAPCSDPHLYAQMPQHLYGPVCKELYGLRLKTEDVMSQAAASSQDAALRLKTVVTEQADQLYTKLPPQAKQLLQQVLEPVQQAHKSALPAISSATAQAKEHAAKAQEQLAPHISKAKELWQQYSRQALLAAMPQLAKVLDQLGFPKPTGDAAKAPPAAAAADTAKATPTPVPITAIPQKDLLPLLDATHPKVEGYLASLYEAAATQIAEKRKAPMWAVTCTNTAECGKFQGQVFSDAPCSFQVDGGFYQQPDTGATLQTELAEFLGNCPSGLVVVHTPEILHPSVVAVLSAATSEGGHLQMDGQPVTTHKALYLVVVGPNRVPVVAEEGVDPLSAEFENKVKEQLEAAMVEQAAGAEGADAIIKSFRRRVDAVLPAKRYDAGTPETAEPAFVISAGGGAGDEGEGDEYAD